MNPDLNLEIFSYKCISASTRRSSYLKVLNGAIENISRQDQNDLLDALLQYIKCTNRFKQN